MIAEISTKVQAWHDSGINSNGEVIKMPNFSISKKLKDQMKTWAGQSYDRISNIRVFGTEYDEGEYI